MLDEAKALPIVWLIDESAEELRTYLRALRDALPDTIEVRGQAPFKALQDYLPVLAYPQTACVITDQRLKVSGIATYTGIELAEFIRGFNTKLPVYILTNVADDTDQFSGSEWSVEQIIKKEDMTDAYGQQIVAARIVRRLNTYEDILDSRSERMQTLLSKGLDGQLDESDLRELETLGLQKTAPTLAQELSQVQGMEQLIRAHEDLMKRYKEFEAQFPNEEGEAVDGE